MPVIREELFPPWLREELRRQFGHSFGADCDESKNKFFGVINKHGQIVKLICGEPIKRRRKRRNKLRPYKRRGVHSRFRESVLPSPLRFFGDEKGVKPKPNAVIGVWKTYVNGAVQQSQNIKTTGVLPDSVHSVRTWDRVNAGPPYREVGPFGSVRVRYPGGMIGGRGTFSSLGNPGFAPGSRWEYQGAFYDDGNWGSDTSSSYQPGNMPTITGYDTLAWDRTKPKVAQGDAGQFLGELRDLPRMLETTANGLANGWRSFGGGYSSVVMQPSNVADNFLNHHFGWVPFISSLKQTIKTAMDSLALLERLNRDNGQWLRRRANLGSTSTTELVMRNTSSCTVPSSGIFQIAGCCAPILVDGISTTGFCEVHAHVEQKTWAVGTFRFYRPEFDPQGDTYFRHLQTVHQLLTMHGLRVTPSLLYELTPWSWLADWFTRVGDYIRRYDDYIVDGIVARDLCIMQHTIRRVVKTSVINFWSGAATLHWVRERTVKARKVAESPYGFDQPMQSLSGTQWAILGAMGFTQIGRGFVARG